MSTTISLSPLRQSAGDGVRPLPVMQADWHEEPVLLLDEFVPYLVAPADRDPLRRPDGSHFIPRRQLVQLRKLEQAGRRFDAIAIVHELDPDGAVAALLPVLEEGPVTCSDEVARLVVGPVPEHPGVARVVRALDFMAGGLSALQAGAERLLDPIVFGISSTDGVLRDGVPALWYPLAAWRW